MCSKLVYWEVGGYNENYSGCLGGGGPFLQRMKMVAGEAKLLPNTLLDKFYAQCGTIAGNASAGFDVNADLDLADADLNSLLDGGE